MSTPITSPLLLLSTKAPWYPRYDAKLSKETNDALRRAFDDIYQLLGSLSIGLQATGTGKILVPAAPTVPALVTGCQLKLPRQGLWIIFGSVTFSVSDAGDVGSIFSLILGTTGQQQSGVKTGVANPINLVAQGQLKVAAQPVIQTIPGPPWSARFNVNGTVKLLVQKDSSGSGATSSVLGANSAIAAVWAGL